MNLNSADDEEHSDTEVIERVLAGSTNDFRHLVKRYENMVYGIMMRHIGDATTAKDLSQEVFIKAFQGLGRFRKEAKFSTWLTRIALNTLNSYYSSRRFKESLKTTSISAASKELPIDEDLESAHFSEQIKLLRVSIAALKPKYREVLTLCALENKSYSEAATILNIPQGTVCSRMNKAFHLLRQKVKKARA